MSTVPNKYDTVQNTQLSSGDNTVTGDWAFNGGFNVTSPATDDVTIVTDSAVLSITAAGAGGTLALSSVAGTSIVANNGSLILESLQSTVDILGDAGVEIDCPGTGNILFGLGSGELRVNIGGGLQDALQVTNDTVKTTLSTYDTTMVPESFITNRFFRFTNDGQIKINSGGGGVPVQPTYILVANVAQQVIYTPTLNISAFPTSSPPLNVNGGVFLDAHIYDFAAGPTVGKFQENAQLGQINIWRFILNYSNKQLNNTGVITVSLSNPLSGFVAKASFALPQGLTAENDRYSEIITIADAASLKAPLGTGNGYVCEVASTTNVDVVFTSITRINPIYSRRP